jgi:hypothetical protein
VTTTTTTTVTVDNASGRPAARSFGRARLVALETGLGGIAAGLASGRPWGYALAGAGVALAVGALARWRGAWANQRMLDRARRGTLTVAPPLPRPSPSPSRPGPAEPLGMAHRLLPALDVVDFADRNEPRRGRALGVLSDGRGHAAVAAFPGGMLPALPAGIVARWLAEDPARPAAAQLVVEQFALPPWDVRYRFQPTVAYRQLPYGGRPIAVRSWLVVRYEPLDAPEAAAQRGGGEAGARAAVAAAAARLRARLAAQGASAVPLSAPEACELLRQLGDADGRGRSLPWIWSGKAATHCTLTARVASQRDWSRLLGGLASCAADRVVTAATLTAEPGAGRPALRVQAAVRLVSPLAQHVAAERDRMQAAGVTGPPVTDQTAGMLATLPLAYPARSLAEASGFATATATNTATNTATTTVPTGPTSQEAA